MPNISNLRDAVEKALAEYRKEEWDEEKCGCSWPNARPPCSYCENGDYTMEGWSGGGYNENGFQYETRERERPLSSGKKSALETILGAKKIKDPLEAKYNAALDKIDELEYSLTQLEEASLEKVMEMLSQRILEQIKAESYEVIWEEVYRDVRKAETPKMKAQINLELREQLKKELRKEILAEMAEANDKL